MQKGFIVLKALLFMIMGCFFVLPSYAAAADDFSSYLSQDDVRQATGIADAKAVAKNPLKGFGGDLNFASGEGAALLMVQILDRENYPSFKKMGNAALAGLGDEAVQGATMPGAPPNFICFLKGARCVTLTTYLNHQSFDRNMLTIEQLTALAKIVASRI